MKKKNALCLNFGSMSKGSLPSKGSKALKSSIKQFIEANDISDIVINNEVFNYDNNDEDGLAKEIVDELDIKDVNVYTFSTLTSKYGKLPTARVRSAAKLELLSNENNSLRFTCDIKADPINGKYKTIYSDVSDKSFGEKLEKIKALIDKTDDDSIMKDYDEFYRYKNYYFKNFIHERGEFQYIGEYKDDSSKIKIDKRHLVGENYQPYIRNSDIANQYREEVLSVNRNWKSHVAYYRGVREPNQIYDSELTKKATRIIEQKENMYKFMSSLDTLIADDIKQQAMLKKGKKPTIGDQSLYPEYVKVQHRANEEARQRQMKNDAFSKSNSPMTIDKNKGAATNTLVIRVENDIVPTDNNISDILQIIDKREIENIIIEDRNYCGTKFNDPFSRYIDDTLDELVGKLEKLKPDVYIKKYSQPEDDYHEGYEEEYVNNQYVGDSIGGKRQFAYEKSTNVRDRNDRLPSNSEMRFHKGPVTTISHISSKICNNRFDTNSNSEVVVLDISDKNDILEMSSIGVPNASYLAINESKNIVRKDDPMDKIPKQLVIVSEMPKKYMDTHEFPNEFASKNEKRKYFGGARRASFKMVDKALSDIKLDNDEKILIGENLKAGVSYSEITKKFNKDNVTALHHAIVPVDEAIHYYDDKNRVSVYEEAYAERFKSNSMEKVYDKLHKEQEKVDGMDTSGIRGVLHESHAWTNYVDPYIADEFDAELQKEQIAAKERAQERLSNKKNSALGEFRKITEAHKPGYEMENPYKTILRESRIRSDDNTYVIGVNDPTKLQKSTMEFLQGIKDGSEVYISSDNAYAKFIKCNDKLERDNSINTKANQIKIELNKNEDEIDYEYNGEDIEIEL